MSPTDAINGAAYTPPPPAPTAQQPAWSIPMQTQGTFWIGQDGNVWVAGSQGVNSAGKADAGSVAYWNNQGFNQQNDPMATDLTPTGGAGTGQTFTDTSAARSATGVTIGSLDQIMNNSITGANAEWKSVNDGYDVEDAENLAKYNTDVESNEITRDTGTQAALRGAAKGARGLYATLGSLGALGGSGRMLANRAVADEANTDLGDNNKNFETNVKSLFNTRSAVEKEEKQRRLDADKIKADTIQSAKHDNASENQRLWREMAGLWTQAGNNGEATNAMAKSSSYTPEMVANTKVNVGQYAKTPLAYSAPEMSKYLAGAKDLSVKAEGGAKPINGALYASTKEREKLV